MAVRTALLCILSCVTFFWSDEQPNQMVAVKRSLTLMGSPFEITVVAPNEDIGYINIQEAVDEVRRIERMISSWDPESETSLINENAGVQPVRVSQELFYLLERSVQISEITEGAFDLTYGALDGIWRFDGSMGKLPTPEKIRAAVSHVGYAKIQLNRDERTVFLPEKGMKIAFGAIGKGYAVDKAKELLISKQVSSGFINATGDVTAWGTKANGEKWLLGVANPLGKNRMFTWVPIIESSASVSGKFDKVVTFNGKRYSHLIDPRTGYPVTEIIRVIVFGKSAELCDALATAIHVLGKEEGLALINQLGDTEVIIIDNFGELTSSEGLKMLNP